jgi:hypothetical protein
MRFQGSMAVFPNGSDETWVEVVDRRGSAVRATVTPMVVYRTCRCEQFALFATNVRLVYRTYEAISFRSPNGYRKPSPTAGFSPLFLSSFYLTAWDQTGPYATMRNKVLALLSYNTRL